MKIRALVASLLVLAFVVSAALAGEAPKPAAKPAAQPTAKKFTPPKEVYECSHCKVGMDKAGKCPLCGMAMTKMKSHICEKCMKEADKAAT